MSSSMINWNQAVELTCDQINKWKLPLWTDFLLHLSQIFDRFFVHLIRAITFFEGSKTEFEEVLTIQFPDDFMLRTQPASYNHNPQSPI